jgi:hypothetical protein
MWSSSPRPITPNCSIAVWRRFELRLSLPAPSEKQLSAFIGSLSERASVKLGVRPQQAAKALRGVSYGEAEQFFLDLARRQVLAMGERSADDIAREQLKIWEQRVRGPVTEEGQDSAGTPAS